MKALRLCTLLIAALLLGACASGPKLADVKSAIPTLKSTEGRVYFYRSSSMLGAAVQPEIRVNGEVVGQSTPGGFFFVDMAPGPKEVSTTTEVEKKLTFVLDAGQTRYVKTYVYFGALVGRVQPQLVDNATGAAELEETSYTGKPLGK
ncbi:MAG: DUF2846 domain-containing protein [Betaproteobacteria bacterium]